MKKFLVSLMIAGLVMFGGNAYAGWWGCLECDTPDPYNAYDVAADISPSIASDWNSIDGDSQKHGTLVYSGNGGGTAGGAATVTADGHNDAYAHAELFGNVDLPGGGGFIIDQGLGGGGNRIVGVYSSASVDSQITGDASGGTQDLGSFWCGEDMPTLRTDLEVFGSAVSDYYALASFHTPGNLQGAFAEVSGFNVATYYGADFEGNDKFLFFTLPVATNALEGEASVLGGGIAGTYRDGKIGDTENQVKAWAITAGTGAADVVEPEQFLCMTYNSQPDNGEFNESFGSGTVNGAAWTMNNTGSYGEGTFGATYEYYGSNDGAIQNGDNYGVAGGYTNVEVGAGSVHVESAGFAHSTGGNVPPQDD